MADERDTHRRVAAGSMTHARALAENMTARGFVVERQTATEWVLRKRHRRGDEVVTIAIAIGVSAPTAPSGGRWAPPTGPRYG